MPIRKRQGSDYWQIDIRTPSGERIRRSADTTSRKAAQEYHDRLKANLWRQERLGDTPDHTFEEAAVKFLRQCDGLRDYATKVRHIRYWRTQFAGRTVRSLTTGDIVEALPTHRTSRYGRPSALTGSTRNRYITTIKRMLNLCEQWEWIDRAPRLPHFNEPDVRIRWEQPEVIAAFIKALRLPWMRDAAIVAVATGMRHSELFGLTPSQVDLAQRNAWITHEGAKSKRARSVPLNDDAIEVLARRMRTARGLIFTRGPECTARIEHIDKRDLTRACREVGIKDFHWHDLRHTWASWHVQRGTPLMVLKELGGWETVGMVQKYAHLAPSHLAAHAATVTFWAHMSEQVEKMPLTKAA